MSETSRGLIIVVEDQENLRKLYRDVLEANGYSVLAAANGEQGLQLVAAHRPKLIVLDIMMPGMDGIEVCKRIRRALGDDVPIIFLSALDTRETVRACLEAGGDDYVIKSESLAKLVERADFWTRRKTPSAHARRKKVLTQARDALTRPQMPAGEAALKTSDGELSSESDDIVLRISRFIALARAMASPDFGQTVAEKLYLLGYLTGVVEFWATRHSALKRRFEDYLRATLRETGVLKQVEIETMLSSLSDLASDENFKDARASGRRECSEAETSVSLSEPTGLRDFEEARKRAGA